MNAGIAPPVVPGISRTAPIPAAQYLRMSTEDQQYSMENQAAAIAQFAQSHSLEVVRTYADPAKRGLLLKNRRGLSQLLHDVLAGNQPYRAILVYDVSRWGRFQDSDEAAHYEFLCRQAGTPVYYCAEQFGTEPTLPNALMKALKRVMAGEYSRELSVKVYEGQKRTVQHGFSCAGSAGYGLRRMLVAPDGMRKQMLKAGERKSISSDRVILVPGPSEEVETVRTIYRLAIEKRSFRDIAKELNRRRITRFGRPWTYQAVEDVLNHPKYAGWNVWGRSTEKLASSRQPVPREQWVWGPTRFEPIVSDETFNAAQAAIHDRAWFLSDTELLERLRALLESKGRLTQKIIDTSRRTPYTSAYARRFGSLRHAYELIGYEPVRREFPVELRRRMLRLKADVLVGLERLFPAQLGIKRQPCHRPRVTLDRKVPLAILMAYCDQQSPKPRWVLQAAPRERENITLVCRCNGDNTAVRDYHLLPRFPGHIRLRLSENDARLLGGHRLYSLSALREAVLKLHARKILTRDSCLPTRPGAGDYLHQRSLGRQ